MCIQPMWDQDNAGTCPVIHILPWQSLNQALALLYRLSVPSEPLRACRLGSEDDSQRIIFKITVKYKKGVVGGSIGKKHVILTVCL